ncbi:MAG: hypothetical protein ACRDOK_07580 [Streptosporangiaceae bacterium]
MRPAVAGRRQLRERQDGWRAGQRRGAGEHVDAVRAAAEALAERGEEARRQRGGRSPGGSCAAIQSGSVSANTTEHPVSEMTPASRSDGWARIVVRPSGGGYRPAAATSSSPASAA